MDKNKFHQSIIELLTRAEIPREGWPALLRKSANEITRELAPGKQRRGRPTDPVGTIARLTKNFQDSLKIFSQMGTENAPDSPTLQLLVKAYERLKTRGIDIAKPEDMEYIRVARRILKARSRTTKRPQNHLKKDTPEQAPPT